MSIYRSFASVLDYPGLETSEQSQRCASELDAVLPSGAELLRKFQESHRKSGTARLQEIYTGSFDMQPDCALNLSYHLFGEDQRRGLFLAKLKELYEQAGFHPGNELPDHLCLMLRYLATDTAPAAKEDLIENCLLPAVSKIRRGLDEALNPYGYVLDALLLWLKQEGGNGAVGSQAGINGHELTAQPG
jgi:nitrate reductase molybdenum cofactor assembly chaperone NarJ/NarW